MVKNLNKKIFHEFIGDFKGRLKNPTIFSHTIKKKRTDNLPMR